jgi:hypothetical protein
MEPREADLKQIPQPRPDEKRKRFRIVKLEERIAPAKGGTHYTQQGIGQCAGGGGGCSLSVE